MAELVVYTASASDFEYGDILEVRDEGGAYGTRECLESFLVVRLDGTKQSLEYLALPAIQTSQVTDSEENTVVEETVLKMRRYGVDLSGIDIEAVRESDWMIPTINALDIVDKL